MAEKSKDEEEDELKFDSSNFNALKVLKLGNVPVPYPNIQPLNNLAEYHSLVSGKKKAREEQASKELPQTKGPVPAPRPKNAPPPPAESEVKVSKRHKRNFLIRMEEKDQKGPMSLLRRSVFEQLRVKVWTRSAAYIRGFCQGYIVAYDKYFNMAMIDVDETYRKPIFPKKNKKPIMVVPIIPSDSPPNSDWEEDTTENSGSDTDKDDTKSQLEIKEKHFWQEKDAVTNNQDEEPKHFSKHCLSSVIEPCLVYNRLKTKVCYRHVNQLFIRGDNIVSIAIVD